MNQAELLNIAADILSRPGPLTERDQQELAEIERLLDEDYRHPR